MKDAKPDKPVPMAEETVRMLFWLRQIPFALALFIFLTADILIATTIRIRGGGIGPGIVLGLTFSQVVLLAVWTSLGPARLLTRTLTGFGAVILVALTLVASIDRSGSGREVLLFFVITVVQWITIQIPFWIFRLIFRWRLCWPGEQVAAPSNRDMQFGIGQLMAWMAMVAITLGIGRLLMPENFGRTGSAGGDEVTIFALLTVFNSLLAWPVVWSAMVPRWWGVWLCATVACCIGLTLAEIFTFRTMLRQGGDEEIFWIMNALQVVAASVALLAMRVSGFHLVRISGKAA